MRRLWTLILAGVLWQPAIALVAAVPTKALALPATRGTACNAPPCDATAALPRERPDQQALSGGSALTQISDPASISPSTTYDFSSDPEDSSPTSFPDGTFAGTGHIELIGPGWSSWNPQILGKHVLFAVDGTYRVNFNAPQQAVGLVAEPNQHDWFEISVEAFDASSSSLGSVTRSIDGFGGAAFLGIESDAATISAIEITSAPGAAGFAFSDLVYGAVEHDPPIVLFVHGWNAAGNAEGAGFGDLLDPVANQYGQDRLVFFQHYQDRVFQQNGSCVNPRALVQPVEPNGGIPLNPESASNSVCDSQGDAGLNALALHHDVKQLYLEGNRRVVIVTSSGGAPIVRGFLAYSTELGDGVWAMVDSVVFLEGAHDGSTVAATVQDNLDIASFLSDNVRSDLDPERPMAADLVPQSDWYGWTNPPPSRLPPLPYYNAYAAIDVVLDMCVLGVCGEVRRDKVGDFVLDEGTDNPHDTPATGGARFERGAESPGWQWRLGEEFHANGLGGVPGAWGEAIDHPATHFNLNPRLSEVKTLDCVSNGPTFLVDELLRTIRGRMDGEPAGCQP